MADQKIKRTEYLISRQFQLRYIGYILLFLYIGAAIAGFIVYWTTWTTLGEKLANVYPRGRLVYIFRDANLDLIIRLLLLAPLFAYIGLRLSHRIAGPVYSIGRYVDNLVKGDYSRVLTLRKGDELKDLAEKVTALCGKLKDDREKRSRAANDIVNILREEKVNPKVIENINTKMEVIKS